MLVRMRSDPCHKVTHHLDRIDCGDETIIFVVAPFLSTRTYVEKPTPAFRCSPEFVASFDEISSGGFKALLQFAQRLPRFITAIDGSEVLIQQQVQSLKISAL